MIRTLILSIRHRIQRYRRTREPAFQPVLRTYATCRRERYRTRIIEGDHQAIIGDGACAWGGRIGERGRA